MIGYRGCFRYVDQPDLFRLELDVLGQVAAQTPNLRLMIPFVRTAGSSTGVSRSSKLTLRLVACRSG